MNLLKTSEFKKQIEAMGFRVLTAEYWLSIRDKTNSTMATVSKRIDCQIDDDYDQISYLNREKRRKLLDVLVEYAKTPIEERIDELEPDTKAHVQPYRPYAR